MDDDSNRSKMEDALSGGGEDLHEMLESTLAVVAKHCDGDSRGIPVIVAGGIFTGGDIARFMGLGAAGVQMGTRFVCTHECDAADEFKQAYVQATEEDIVVIKSPIGLPLRVVRNEFVDRLLAGERIDFRCQYRCLRPCKPSETQYCVADAMVNAYRGDLSRGFATCGANAWRIDKIVSVQELMDELVAEAEASPA